MSTPKFITLTDYQDGTRRKSPIRYVPLQQRKPPMEVDNILEWLMDRSDNCGQIAKQKSGADRAEWEADAAYFLAAAKLIADAYSVREGVSRG